MKRPSFLCTLCLVCLWILGQPSARAAAITQSINNTNAANNTNWNGALWGTPPACPAAGNSYVVPEDFTLRTPYVSTNWSALTFAGDSLTNNGIMALKHGNWPATVNLTLTAGAMIQHSQGPTSPATTNTPLAGSVTVAGNATLSAPNAVGPRHIWIQGALRGAGDLTVSLFTNTLFLSANASEYTGNWNVTGGRLEIWSGSSMPLGAGSVTLNGTTNSLTFNATNNLVVANVISGAGPLIKCNSGSVTLTGADSYTGITFVTNGVLKLAGSGSLLNSAGVHLEAGGVLDVITAPGFTLGAQFLRGSGVVVGDLSASSGSVISVGLGSQCTQLTLSNNLTLGGGETLNFDLGVSSNDVLKVTGSLTLNSVSTIAINLLQGYVNPGTYRLINYSGALQGPGFFELSSTAGTRQTFTLNTSTPGQVNLEVKGSPTNLVWAGDGVNNTWDVGATLNWNHNQEAFYNIDSVSFDDSGVATPEILVSQALQPGSVTVSNRAKDYVIGVASSGITCTGSLVKRGSGSLTLANDGNSFSGPILIDEGTLSIGNGVNIQGTIGSGAISNNGALVLNKYYSTDLSTRGGLTLGNVISGSGSVRVAGQGHTPTFTGANTYTGSTVIEPNCALYIRNNRALGATNNGTVVQAGARLGFTSPAGTYTVAEPLTLNGNGFEAVGAGALWMNTANNSATFTGPVTLGSATWIRNTDVTKFFFSNSVSSAQQALRCSAENYSGQINFWGPLVLGDSASLTKSGPGYLTLGGSSNLVGSLIVNNGYTIIASTAAPRVATVTVNDASAIGEANPSGSFLQIGNGGGGGAFPTSPVIELAGVNAALICCSTNPLTLTNLLVGAGKLSLITNTGLTITSSNGFTGNVVAGSSTSSGGIVTLRNAYGLGDGSVAKNVSIYRSELRLIDGLTLPAALAVRIAGYSGLASPGAGLIPIHSLSGTNVISSGITVLTGGGHGEIACETGQLTILGGVGLDSGVSGRLLILSGTNGTGVIKGAIADGDSGSLGVTKKGAGTWVLEVGGAYTGDTRVEGGTLAFGAGAGPLVSTNVQLAGAGILDVSGLSGGLTVSAYQTLSGSGTVQGNVTCSGMISPGASVGTLNVSGSLSLGGTTVMELNRTNTPNADRLAAAMLALGGTLVVTNIGPELQDGDTFTLFAGTLSGAFAVTNLPVLASASLFWDVSLLNSAGILRVASSAAPAPRIQQVVMNGTNLVLQVPSQAGFNYVLEASKALLPAVWTGIQTNAGGGVLTFSLPVDSATPQQFFRIRVE